MEIVKKKVMVRGQLLEVSVPGVDASPDDLLSAYIEALTLAVIASANEEGLDVLRAYGILVDDLPQMFSQSP